MNGLKALRNKDSGLLGRLAAEEGADMLLLQVRVCICQNECCVPSQHTRGGLGPPN